MSPLLQRTPLSSSQRSRWSTPSTGGRVGRTWPCFFKGSCQRGSCSSQGGLHDSLHRGCGGEVVRQARGGEGGGSGSIPARQTAGKTIGGRVLLRLNAKVCGFR